MKTINYQGHEIVNNTDMSNEKALEVFGNFAWEMWDKGHPLKWMTNRAFYFYHEWWRQKDYDAEENGDVPAGAGYEEFYHDLGQLFGEFGSHHDYLEKMGKENQ